MINYMTDTIRELKPSPVLTACDLELLCPPRVSITLTKYNYWTPLVITVSQLGIHKHLVLPFVVISLPLYRVIVL